MKNSLIMTSSITPPTSRPEMIFGSPGDILYRSFTQLLNDPNISLSPGNKHNAPMIVIIVVGTTAFLSNRNSFHRPTIFERIKPIAASTRPYKMPYWTAPLSANISVVIPCSCNCCVISGEKAAGRYNPVQYPPTNPLSKTTSRILYSILRLIR